MQLYSEFEKNQNYLQGQKEREKAECIDCPTCKSSFFEQVEVAKYSKYHQTGIGQRVVEGGSGQKFHVLRCISCQELLELNVNKAPGTPSTKEYAQLIDTLNGPKPESEPKTKAPLTKMEQEVLSSLGG